MLIFSRQNRFKCCNLHDLVYIFLDNGVMTTPKRRILSFVFTVLCFKEPLLIRTTLHFICCRQSVTNLTGPQVASAILGHANLFLELCEKSSMCLDALAIKRN